MHDCNKQSLSAIMCRYSDMIGCNSQFLCGFFFSSSAADDRVLLSSVKWLQFWQQGVEIVRLMTPILIIKHDRNPFVWEQCFDAWKDSIEPSKIYIFIWMRFHMFV